MPLLIAALLAAIAQTPGQPINGSAFAPGSTVKLERGHTYGRITVRPSIPLTFEAAGTGPDPIITDPERCVDTFAGTGHLTFRGLHFVGGGESVGSGAECMDGIDWLTFERCTFEACAIGLVLDGTGAVGPSHVSIIECTFTRCGATGWFANKVSWMVVDRTIVDSCGWGDAALTGRPPTQSHGSYTTSSCQYVTTRRSLFSRNRMNGMRGAGTVVIDSVFLDNGSAIAAGPETVYIGGIVAMYSHDPEPAVPWGVGIDLNSPWGCTARDDVIAYARSSGNMSAFSLHGPYARVDLRENTAIDWRLGFWLGPESRAPNTRERNSVMGSPDAVNLAPEWWAEKGNVATPATVYVGLPGYLSGWTRPVMTEAAAVQRFVELAEQDRAEIERFGEWVRGRVR